MKKYTLPPAAFNGPLSVLKDITYQADEKVVRKAFRKACETVKQQHDEDKKNNDTKAKANLDLRRRIYLIGMTIIEEEKIEALKELFPDEPRRRKGLPSLNENVFFWILTHMYARNDDMSLSSRNRTAYQLLYACRHRIPPYLLNGFLHQVGNPDGIGKKVKNFEYEPWASSFKDADIKKKN